MNAPVRYKTRSQIGCLIVLVCFSAFLALVSYPSGASRLAAAFGLLALTSIFLRVGWFVPFTIAGSYFGMLVLDPPLKGGTIDSQMDQTVRCILVGTIVGFAVGALIDVSCRGGTRHTLGSDVRTADEPKDAGERG